MQAIYLYKPPQTENLPKAWTYYRVTSIDAEEPAGTLHAPVEVCKVSWPTFEDILPTTETPGIAGLQSAEVHLCRLLKKQWKVYHGRSVLLGFLT